MANEKAGFDLPFSLARLVEIRNGATAKAGRMHHGWLQKMWRDMMQHMMGHMTGHMMISKN